MSSPFTCSKCGRVIVGNPFRYNGKNVCALCYDEAIENAKRLDNEKSQLFTYIKKLFAIDECPPELVSNIERLIDKGYKTSGIKGTLYYYYEIEGNKTSPDFVFLVPKIIEQQYENAKTFIQNRKRIREHNEQVDINVPAQTVYIQPTKKKTKKFNYRMEDL